MLFVLFTHKLAPFVVTAASQTGPYVQANASNRAHFTHAQWRQDSIDDGARSGLLARREDGGAREDIYRHILALAESDANVKIVILRLPDQNSGGIGAGHKTDETCGGQCMNQLATG